MRNTIIVIIMALVFANAAPALADEASHRKATEELFVLMDMENTLNAAMDQSLMMEFQQNPELWDYEGVIRKFFAKYMSWESLKEDFLKIYMEEFTEAEIKDLTAFYKTPTGRKAIEKQPILFTKGAELGQKRVQDNLAELAQMITEETERLYELQKKDKEQEPQGTAPEGAGKKE